MQSDDQKKDNVLEFPVQQPAPMVLACMSCGNQLFFLHESGNIQCGHCHGILENLKAELFETTPNV